MTRRPVRGSVHGPEHGSTAPASAPQVRELTAAGRGGVSVLELAGRGALAWILGRTGRSRLPVGRPVAVRLAVDADLVEEALVLVESDERVELHVHGSPPLVRRLCALLAPRRVEAVRARVEERALARLATASSEAGARILLDQARGALRRELGRLALAAPERWRRGLAELDEAHRVLERALEPARVVLAGRANAGKSTLFNALVGRERVVVADAEGTTRDAVTARVLLGAYPVDLVDTAGDRALDPREPAADVERAGQARARGERERADLVLWLHAVDDPSPPAATRRQRSGDAPLHRVLASRSDLGPATGSPGGPRISAAKDPAGARRAVERAFVEALGLPARPWLPGAAVPVDRELARELAALRDLVPTAARRRAAAELLGAAVAAESFGSVPAAEPSGSVRASESSGSTRTVESSGSARTAESSGSARTDPAPPSWSTPVDGVRDGG